MRVHVCNENVMLCLNLKRVVSDLRADSSVVYDKIVAIYCVLSAFHIVDVMHMAVMSEMGGWECRASLQWKLFIRSQCFGM